MKSDRPRVHLVHLPQCAASIIDVIGNTPMVELQRIAKLRP